MNTQCPSCQHPMTESARLCTRCGYDRVARVRRMTGADPAPEPPAPAPASPWTGPTAVALGILAVFGAAAPLVWMDRWGTGVYAGCAVGVFVPLWFVQRSRARRFAEDPGLPEDEPLMSGFVRMLSDDDQTWAGVRRRAEARALHRAMFSRETAGRVQSALLASMLAVLAAGLMAVAAYGVKP